MKLATLNDGTRDGQLLIVSKDNTKWVSAADIAKNLQAALDDWDRVEPLLQTRYKQLNENKLPKGNLSFVF